MESTAFQDLLQHNLCFGCGARNQGGLQIKSYWEGDEAVCHFTPEPHHSAGPPHVVNGGIISTIIDCHSVCTAIADAYRREGREIGSGPMIWYATASLHVDYLQPTPIDKPVALRARVVKSSDRKTTVHCSAISAGEECARAEVVAVRVPNEWFAGN